jgi:peptidoglycan hydrolase-like protein with peptidoglycan-binding domain
MSDNEVSELQKVLKDLKFFTYPNITKYFGNVTKNALLAYQKFNKLVTSGITDKATRDTLNGEEITVQTPVVKSTTYKFTKFLYIGSTGTEVKQLQLKLTELGYYNGPITSYFGSLTKAAVIKLQKANNMNPAPGWAGPGTREVLNGK